MMQTITLTLNMATFSGGFSLISNENQVLIDCVEGEGYPWANLLVSRIQDSLKQLGKDFSNLKKIVFTQGPGSFTGIRIGIAVARTLSQFLKIPAFELTTLQAWAAATQSFALSQGYAFIDVVINSKRPDLYIQQFCSKTLIAVGPITTQYPQDIHCQDSTIFSGDGTKFLSIKANQIFPQVTLSASILNYFQENHLIKQASFSPLYFNAPLKSLENL